MSYTLSILSCALLAAGTALASPIDQSSSLLDTRASSSTSQVYAYGGLDIGGLPMIYADGYAYLGNTPPSNASVSTNVTITLSTSSSPVRVSPIKSSVTWTDTKYLFINPYSPANLAVQIAAASPADNYTDSGYLFYGKVLFWRDALGGLSSNFFAVPVAGQAGTYLLKWDDGEPGDGSVPVALKILAPGAGATVPDS